MEKKKKIPTQEDIAKLLDECYQKVQEGIPHVSRSVEDLANDYLKLYSSNKLAAKAMIKNQVAKCATSGFITGFGGAIALPVAIPANIGSVLYVQMRMIACTAYMAGYDLNSDQTQTFVYACLAGVALNNVLKRFGMKFAEKVAEGMVKKIPGKVLIAINQKIGFRLLTKSGTTGLINFTKLIPGVGALVGGGLDLTETRVIGNRAYKWFMEGDFSPDDTTEELVIDIDPSTEDISSVDTTESSETGKEES